MKRRGYNSFNSWLALIAVTVVEFFSVLPMRLTGLLFVIIIQNYNTDREHAIMPIVIFGVLRTLLGPLTGILGEMCGCRIITLTGCALIGVGIGTCYFAETVTHIIICYGVITGLGFALSHTLLPTILRQHFNKDFNLVNGLSQAGSCLGTAIMTPVVLYLNKEYGVSGMFLILSAIISNCIAAAIFLRTPNNEDDETPEMIQEDEIKKLNNDIQQNQITSSVKDEIKSSENLTNENKLQKNIKNEETSVYFSTEANKIHFPFMKKHNNINSSDIVLVQYSGKDRNLMAVVATNEINSETDYKNFSTEDKILSTEDKSFSTEVEKKSAGWQLKKLFADPVFYIIMFTQSFHGFASTLNWAVIVDYAADKGIPTDLAIYFVMFMPVASMFGNLCLNWIVDGELVSRAHFTTVCFLLMALNTVFINWSYNFPLLMTSVMIFCFISGAIKSTFPGTIYDYIGKDKQNMAMASRVLPISVMCFAKAPLVGYCRDTLGSYAYVYDILAACCIFSAIISLLTPVAVSFRKTEDKCDADPMKSEISTLENVVVK